MKGESRGNSLSPAVLILIVFLAPPWLSYKLIQPSRIPPWGRIMVVLEVGVVVDDSVIDNVKCVIRLATTKVSVNPNMQVM